jgi:hypothetical protein
MKMGGSSNKAYKQARADEERRRREIQSAQRRIEGIFASPEREQQVRDFINANLALRQSELDRGHRDAGLDLKFALARSGLSGGSADIDQNADLAENYFRGSAEAVRAAENAGAQLRAQDQSSKQQLFAQLLGGADATTAAQNAGQMMRTNAALAGEEGIYGAFDNLFGQFADLNKASKVAAGERRASRDYGSLFGPRPKAQITVPGAV